MSGVSVTHSEFGLWLLLLVSMFSAVFPAHAGAVFFASGVVRDEDGEFMIRFVAVATAVFAIVMLLALKGYLPKRLLGML